MDEKKKLLSRRSFLVSVGAGGTAAAAAVVGTNAVSPSPAL